MHYVATCAILLLQPIADDTVLFWCRKMRRCT